MRTYVLKAELKMDAKEVVKEWNIGLATPKNRTGATAVGGRDHNHHATSQWCVRNYSYFYIPVPAEDAVKLSCEEIDKNGRKNQTKTRWVWNGRHNENRMRCGKRKWWTKSSVTRWKISKAAARCKGRKAGRIDSNTRRELRSSSSLRVDAIQAKDIFIRGCYL